MLEVNVNNNYSPIYIILKLKHSKKYIFYTTPLHGEYIFLSK